MILCIATLSMGCWRAPENLPHTGGQVSHGALEK